MAQNSLLRASVTTEANQVGPGDPCDVLVDGADTAIQAQGLTGYNPTPGDRLLVQKVGGVVEIVQFLSRGTVPYITGDDLSDMQDQIDTNTSTLTDTSALASATSGALTDYQASNDAAISGLQAGYDALTGLGQVPVQEDFFLVGDDPSLSTYKAVQISTFVQSGLGAGDGQSLGDALGLASAADVGDAEFNTTDSPMTVFYNAFVAAGLTAKPWNA